LEHLNSEI